MLPLPYHLWALFRYPSIKKVSSFVALIELVMLAEMNNDRWTVWWVHPYIFGLDIYVQSVEIMGSPAQGRIK